jgi:PAS domain S-box-containing protein
MTNNAPNAEQQRHLLLVDDEAGILQALRRVLRRDGYVIHLAASAEDGLAILVKEPIGVIVSDQRMPVMTGSEFLSKVKEMRPDTIRIVLSGYTELNSITDAINKGAIYKFLTKPWDDDLLREHIAEAFFRFEMKGENEKLAALNRAMVDAIPDALFLVNAGSRSIVKVNAAAGKLVGCDSAALVGKDITDIEPLPLDQCYWEEIASGNFRPLLGAETEYQRFDGQLTPVRKTTSWAAEGDGGIVLVLAHDLTHERRVETSLERLNAEMASIFEAISDGLLVLDANRVLVRMNRRLREIWSIPDEIVASADGDAILGAMAAQSTNPDGIAAEFLAHFASPEAQSSGYFERTKGDPIRWFGNPQILDNEVIGHVFGFSASAPPEAIVLPDT